MKNFLILVTGGAGYIGSHVVRELQSCDYKVIVLDNLVYGHSYIVEEVLKVPLVISQAGCKKTLGRLLSGNHDACQGQKVDAVMHFAAYAYVGESVKDPAKYYRNNLCDTFNLLEALKEEGERRGGPPVPIIFSSTCASYGIPSQNCNYITENSPQNPINPYGKSKLMSEQIIKDFGSSYGMPSVIFRYFNAAGAHPSLDLGEDHTPETHLIPLIFDAISSKIENLQVYGRDYETPDGTCIRDFIHVSDIAIAHVLGLSHLLSNGGRYIFNLGSGKGYSVQEIIDLTEEVTGFKVPRVYSDRREGDPPILVASSDLAKRVLSWSPKYSDIKSIVLHAWNWYNKLNSLNPQALSRTVKPN